MAKKNKTYAEICRELEAKKAKENKGYSDRDIDFVKDIASDFGHYISDTEAAEAISTVERESGLSISDGDIYYEIKSYFAG